MKRGAAILLFSFIIAVTLSGQELIATAVPGKVSIGEIVRITYHFSGESGNSIKLPKFMDFRLVSGPSRSSSVTIINGKKSVSKEVSVDLMSLKKGIIRLSPATIEVNNRLIKSNSLLIHVTENKEMELSVPEKLKKNGYGIVAEISRDTAYPGQQLIITYKILSSKDIERYQIVHESSYDGCLRAQFTLNEPAQINTIDGRVYRSQVIARRSIFPYHVGLYTIDPMIMNLYLPTVQRKSLPFFFNNLKRVRVYSNSVQFLVLPQSENTLDSLLAVGEFNMDVAIPTSSFTTDDIIDVKVRLQGNSDPSLMRAPEIVSTFSYYLPPPQVETINKSANTDGITYLKTFQYFIQPQDTGIFQFHFYFPYLNENGKVDTLVSQNFSIPIRVGEHYNQNLTIQPAVEREKKYTRMYLWLALGIVVLVMVVVFYLRKRKKKEDMVTEISDVDENKDIKLIEESLSTALISIQMKDIDTAFNKLSTTLRQAANLLTEKDIELKFSSRDSHRELINRVGQEEADKWLEFVKSLEKMQYGVALDFSQLSQLQWKVEDWIHDKFPEIKGKK